MNRTATYQSQQLAGASPALLVSMLYDKAIASLKEAVRAIEAGDVQGRWTANNRAQEIINHLWLTLDMEKGGDIAANLDRLYSFMLNRLSGVDMRNDPKPAQEVIRLLEPLRSSWQQLARGAAAAPAAAAAARYDSRPTERLALSA